MTFPANPEQRSPKGDHNRRLALAIDPGEFAADAGITPDELHSYEFSPPDGPFDSVIAEKVVIALERLEASKEPRVENGPVPANTAEDIAPGPEHTI